VVFARWGNEANLGFFDGEHSMVRQLVIALLLSTGVIAAQAHGPTPKSDLTPLFANIWRITSATPYPSSGSIYIFLRSGTLLETSCVETYRIATWKPDPKSPGTLEVIEDGRLAFTASILSLTSHDMRLRQTLAFGNREVREVTFSAIDKEFVCPDMPK
jgi:hypothetical protein